MSKFRHGEAYIKTRTSEYSIWCEMRHRCSNPKHVRFAAYGGRGITVCERWNLYENFLADMGRRPAGYSLERINNNLGYSPENCKWATPSEQNSNKSSNRKYTLNGETKTITEWERSLHFRHWTIFQRLGRGWSFEKAATTPVRFMRKPQKDKIEL